MQLMMNIPTPHRQHQKLFQSQNARTAEIAILPDISRPCKCFATCQFPHQRPWNCSQRRSQGCHRSFFSKFFVFNLFFCVDNLIKYFMVSIMTVFKTKREEKSSNKYLLINLPFAFLRVFSSTFRFFQKIYFIFKTSQFSKSLDTTLSYYSPVSPTHKAQFTKNPFQQGYHLFTREVPKITYVIYIFYIYYKTREVSLSANNLAGK